jgi:uncharacterized membrane protein
MKGVFNHWRSDFLTGLVIVLPTIVTLAVVHWVLDSISGFTNLLLIFLPRSWTHESQGQGGMYWYYSVLAFLCAIIIISMIGRSAKYYVTMQMLRMADDLMLRIPLLNKIYGAIKQVNRAFTSTNKTAFKKVVMVEYPRKGVYSIGFLTGQAPASCRLPGGVNYVSVFIPTTPMPTNGFLIQVQEGDVILLEMSVAEGIKYIISLGAIMPEVPGSTEPLMTSRSDKANGA